MEQQSNPIPEQASPGSTRPALDIGVPGCPSGRVTGQQQQLQHQKKRRKWTRTDNIRVTECFFRSEPGRHGFRKRMHEMWKEKYPEDRISEQGLLNQKRAIFTNRLLSTLEIEAIKKKISGMDVTTDEETQSSVDNDERNINNPVQTEDVTIEDNDESSLTLEEENLRAQIIAYMGKYHEFSSRPQIRKVKNKPECRRIIAGFNKIIKTIPTQNITELNALTYATAKMIEETVFPERPAPDTTCQNVPPWRRRMVKKIDGLRKEVNVLTSAKEHNGRINRRIYRKYQLHVRQLSEAIEEAKQKLIAISHRLKRYDARNEQYAINQQFKYNPRKVYKQLRKESNEEAGMPNKDETMAYWRDIWERPVKYNKAATWISEVVEDSKDVPQHYNVTIKTEDIRNKLRGMSNWRAPGPDQVQIFWMKKLTAIHDQLCKHMTHLLKGALTRGQLL